MSEYLPYQQRVVDEQSALTEKLMSLAAFFEDERFSKLPDIDQQLMVLQFNAMSSYGLLLDMRIKNFNKEMS